jgi:16S rRNA (guanine527-N7)-methyltransferase
MNQTPDTPDVAIPDFVVPELAALDVVLPSDRVQLLGRYLAMLLEVNEKFNLTAIREPSAAWRRHIIDSLTLYPGLAENPDGTMIVDIGSGGGLPGIPLAIAFPQFKFTLVEATGKKARFLEETAKTLGLTNVKVVNERAEKVGRSGNHREKYDVAVCRAIGPMTELLEYSMPLLKLGGLLLAMKGPRAEEELEQAADALTILGAGEIKVFDAYPEGAEFNTVVVCVTKENDTPDEFPRLPGIPRQQPL